MRQRTKPRIWPYSPPSYALMGTAASQGNAWGVWQAAHKHRSVLHPALQNHTNCLVLKAFIASSPLLHPEEISFIKHSSWRFKCLCLLAILGTATQDNLGRGYSGPSPAEDHTPCHVVSSEKTGLQTLKEQLENQIDFLHIWNTLYFLDTE